MSFAQATVIVIAASLGLLAWSLVRPRVRIVVSERGILDRNSRLGWIPWDEIEGAYQPGAGDSDGLSLRLRRTDRLARRARRRRGVELPGEKDSVEIRLDLRDTGFTAVEVVQQIVTHSGQGPVLPGTTCRASSGPTHS